MKRVWRLARRSIEVWGNRHFGERQQCEHRNEKLCGMNAEHLGWNTNI